MVSSGVISLFLLLFGGLLASSTFYNKIQLEPFLEAIRQEKIREETLRAESIEATTKGLLEKLRHVRDIQTKNDGYERLLRGLVVLPPEARYSTVPGEGVVFSSLAVSEKGENGESITTVQISGHADTRDQVIAMENAIKSNAEFANLVSPFSNKNKERDIDFIFTFNISGAP